MQFNLAKDFKRVSYKSKFVKVNNAKLHYIELGQGEPIVFLHGMATSSYLWRNIIPNLASHGRCIALDLVGMGNSDKPNIPYRIFDFINYFEGFIRALDLKNVTLVLHGWGSLIGFDYARRHESNVKAIAFLEGYIRPLQDNMLTMPAQELLKELKNSARAYNAVVRDNIILKKMLPSIILRKLTATELENYIAPFQTPENRQLLWRYIQDLPVEKGPADTKALLNNCSQWLQRASLPKLMLYSVPGFITAMSDVVWANQHLPNITIHDLGEAYHCPQETNPMAVSAALEKWYQGI